MNVELDEGQKATVRHALETYLSDLREEIVKTEKHEWKEGLHNEEDTLKDVIKRLH